jgi:UDP-glucose 4-epimerase
MPRPPEDCSLGAVSTFVVTGAAGFIGSNLCDRLLAEGKRVVAVDDLSKGRIANLAEARGYGQQFNFYNLDIRAPGLGEVLQRHSPEVLMHLAAQASVEVSVRDPMADASVNIMGLLNVLQAASGAGVRKVVYAASGGTLYGQPRKLPVKETARRSARPLSPYGISKKVGEDYLALYQRSRGVDYTALALGNVYGPRQDSHGEAGVVAIFSRAMVSGETPTVFGDGEQTRDYVFVDDTVHAFSLAAAEGSASGQVVNIGTGVETSVNQIFRLLAKAAGFRGQPRLGLAREGEVRSIALDIDLAANKLGWKPWTSLEEGLKATVEWARSAE